MSIEYVLIHSTNSREEILIMGSILEAHGIKFKVQQESIGKLYAIASDGLGEARLFVAEEDADRAIRLLNDMEQEQAQEQE